MDKVQIFQSVWSIITIAVIIITNFLLKKESAKIKAHIPEIENISAKVIQDLKEANKIDAELFPNSPSSIIFQDINSIIASGVKNIDKSVLNSGDADKLIIAASKTIGEEFNKRIGANTPKG